MTYPFPRLTLRELFDTRYLPHCERRLKPKTHAEYVRLASKVILPMLGNRLIGDITMDDCEQMHLFTAGKVQANRALALLSSALGYAVERRLLAVNPCRGVARNRETAREFFYKPEQTRALLDACRRDKGADGGLRAAYVALLLLTGARPEELLDLAVSWRHGSVLRTPDGKTGSRTIFLSPAACAILDGLTPGSDGRYFPRGMSTRRTYERLCREAGVPVARRYDLRHTFASAALASGQSLPVIGQLLGHTKAQTTLRYAHLSPDTGLEAAAAAAERMGA